MNKAHLDHIFTALVHAWSRQTLPGLEEPTLLAVPARDGVRRPVVTALVDVERYPIFPVHMVNAGRALMEDDRTARRIGWLAHVAPAFRTAPGHDSTLANLGPVQLANASAAQYAAGDPAVQDVLNVTVITADALHLRIFVQPFLDLVDSVSTDNEGVAVAGCYPELLRVLFDKFARLHRNAS